MWFGDLVTMRWWDDLWLNESFATFASVICQSEATHWTNAWTTFANLEKTWAYRQDQLPSTHPIQADIRDIEDVEVNFDGITYAKGASVLKQLVAWVGRDAFVAGVRMYFDRHAWGNTELSDLLGALEETSGRDLSSWTKEWLETAGSTPSGPTSPSTQMAGSRASTSFRRLQRTTPHCAHTALPLASTTALTKVSCASTASSSMLSASERPLRSCSGSSSPICSSSTTTTSPTQRSALIHGLLRRLIDSIGELRDSLARALCWTAAWDMTRDAELSARDWVALVRSGLPYETDIGVLQAVVRQAVSALYLFTPTDQREASLAEFAGSLHDQSVAAPHGSDHQLALFRAFVSIARTPEQLSVVEGALHESVAPEGLSLDADLRWALVHRLVATGRAAADLIDSEFDRDHTASGERQAAAARAALPTEEGKDAAWRAAVETDELPNALLGATIAGLNSPDHSELNRRLVDRYFAMLDEVWRTRTNDTAQSVVVGLYPGFLVEQQTVDLTDEYLAAHDAPPALRRLLLEGADGVRRSLRAQKAY